MIEYAFAVLAFAWLLALAYIWKLSGSVKGARQSSGYWMKQAAAFELDRNQLRTKLNAAEKALIDLEGQTPGRDKTGRFVKREKVSVEKV